MIKTTTLALFLLLAFTVHSKIEVTTPKLGLYLYDMAQIVEGVLMGVANEELKELEYCLSDSGLYDFSYDLNMAVQEFKEDGFNGMRKGLREFGKAVGLIPDLVKKCNRIKTDVTTLTKMAEIFENPLTLSYTVGHNLIINGVDVFDKLMTSISSFKSGDYITFGK